MSFNSSHLKRRAVIDIWRNNMKFAPVLMFAFGSLFAQAPDARPLQQAATPSTTENSVPIYRVTVVSRQTKAVNYHHRSGTTHIAFRGTELMPAA